MTSNWKKSSGTNISGNASLVAEHVAGAASINSDKDDSHHSPVKGEKMNGSPLSIGENSPLQGEAILVIESPSPVPNGSSKHFGAEMTATTDDKGPVASADEYGGRFGGAAAVPAVGSIVGNPRQRITGASTPSTVPTVPEDAEIGDDEPLLVAAQPVTEEKKGRFTVLRSNVTPAGTAPTAAAPNKPQVHAVEGKPEVPEPPAADSLVDRQRQPHPSPESTINKALSSASEEGSPSSVVTAASAGSTSSMGGIKTAPSGKVEQKKGRFLVTSAAPGNPLTGTAPVKGVPSPMVVDEGTALRSAEASGSNASRRSSASSTQARKSSDNIVVPVGIENDVGLRPVAPSLQQQSEVTDGGNRVQSVAATVVDSSLQRSAAVPPLDKTASATGTNSVDGKGRGVQQKGRFSVLMDQPTSNIVVTPATSWQSLDDSSYKDETIDGSVSLPPKNGAGPAAETGGVPTESAQRLHTVASATTPIPTQQSGINAPPVAKTKMGRFTVSSASPGDGGLSKVPVVTKTAQGSGESSVPAGHSTGQGIPQRVGHVSPRRVKDPAHGGLEHVQQPILATPPDPTSSERPPQHSIPIQKTHQPEFRDREGNGGTHSSHHHTNVAHIPLSRATSSSMMPPVSIDSKGVPQQGEGLGKVLFFLDQLRHGASEADKTIRSMQLDMKLLREKNKELEAKSREWEKKFIEEKGLREAAEAKNKTLRKKVKELKELLGRNGQHPGNDHVVQDTMHGEAEPASSMTTKTEQRLTPVRQRPTSKIESGTGGSSGNTAGKEGEGYKMRKNEGISGTGRTGTSAKKDATIAHSNGKSGAANADLQSGGTSAGCVPSSRPEQMSRQRSSSVSSFPTAQGPPHVRSLSHMTGSSQQNSLSSSNISGVIGGSQQVKQQQMMTPVYQGAMGDMQHKGQSGWHMQVTQPQQISQQFHPQFQAAMQPSPQQMNLHMQQQHQQHQHQQQQMQAQQMQQQQAQVQQRQHQQQQNRQATQQQLHNQSLSSIRDAMSQQIPPQSSQNIQHQHPQANQPPQGQLHFSTMSGMQDAATQQLSAAQMQQKQQQQQQGQHQMHQQMQHSANRHMQDGHVSQQGGPQQTIQQQAQVKAQAPAQTMNLQRQNPSNLQTISQQNGQLLHQNQHQPVSQQMQRQMMNNPTNPNIQQQETNPLQMMQQQQQQQVQQKQQQQQQQILQQQSQITHQAANQDPFQPAQMHTGSARATEFDPFDELAVRRKAT